MIPEHRARIAWSPERVRQGLPAVPQIIDPAWFLEDLIEQTDGWSLVCTFEPPLNEQGSPTTARVRFMMNNAPHQRLRPGVSLQLFERGTGQFARVDILD